MKRRVVVTGLGAVTAIGQDVESFWSGCLAGNTSVSRIPDHWLGYRDFNSQIWSPLPQTDFSKYGITRLEEKQLDKSSLIALACAFQALDSANLRYDLHDKKRNTYAVPSVQSERFGVFMGTGIGGLSTFASSFSYQILDRQKEALSKLLGKLADGEPAEALRGILEKMRCPRRFNPFGVSMTMPNACSGNLGIKFRLLGSNNTFCAACASGTVAVGYGFKAVRGGELDLALVGGVEYLYDEYGTIFLGFDVVRALTNANQDPERANCPFDRDHSGFLFGEGGGAVLVIEELEHALKRGARIYAEILGYGETCDGHNIMMMESGGSSIMRMLRQALSDAGVSANEIDYINSHGTGTVLNDQTETDVIDAMFGKEVLINSTKSLLGHTLGASGAIEAVVTALSIYHKTTHICRNLRNPMKDLNFVTKRDSFPIRKAISQSFGFGGHNAVLVFGEYS
jgi:3-oxoacyl-[acyl-carrier-protein] synthase II